MIPRGKESAALALHRFGFGPGSGFAVSGNSIAAIANDPRGALLADLDRPKAGILPAALPSSAQAARTVSDFRAEEQANKKLAQRLKTEADAREAMAGPDPMKAGLPQQPNQKTAENKQPPLPQQIMQDEAAARFEAAVAANIGFVERLVWFWSNHFCLSADKDVAMAGAYEREAIRPHVLGRFADMLVAVESHPAMLFYLDNVQSMGADSIAGINRDKGLNENLGREIMELHTLGVRSGYSQADVTSFANVLTGWTMIDPAEPAHGGEFIFNKRLHEPGARNLLGKSYSEGGVEQGRAVLGDLAHHPATAQHVAHKLARHFVADEPPPALVGRLARTFRDTDGNLKEVSKALVAADEAWMQARGKLKPPSEWIIGTLRMTAGRWKLAAGANGNNVDMASPGIDRGLINRLLKMQAVLGEPLWRPPAPNGFPDTDAAWIDGVPRRLDVANQIGRQLPPETDPLDLLERGLGPLASADTRRTVARAESREQAFTLLVMAPEFLRR